MNNKKYLVTGGAGFIGSNLVAKLLSMNADVTIYDNLSRPNVNKNIEWLKSISTGKLSIVVSDIRDREAVDNAVKEKDVIFHLAGQVAVTTSVNDPFEDFDINLKGTLNLLEAMRKNAPQAILLYSSSNKVYGGLEDIELVEGEEKYDFVDDKYKNGIDESRNLDFHSPYGCSKGAAGQYIHDYARVYGLKTIVFRQSCIYGDRQFGTEDQGWLFHFLRLISSDQPIKIFGNGKQVRDVLYVDDLISAYLKAVEQIDVSSRNIYNIGGGRSNSVSLLQSINQIEQLLDKKAKIEFLKPRPGDQKIFISNNTKISRDLDWQPNVDVDEGISKLKNWIDSI